MPDPFEELYEREKQQLDLPPPVTPPDAFSQLYEQERQNLPVATPEQVKLPPSITQDQPGWQGKLALKNPLSGGFWKQMGTRMAQNLDFVDRHTFRHARQPLIEAVRPSSFKDPGGDVDLTSILRGVGGITKFLPGGQTQPSGGMSERDATLQQFYQMFESERGRPPSYMERLNIQQETTPWWAELLAEAPLAVTPLGSAKYLGTGLSRAGGRLITSGARQGGLRGAGQQAAGYGLYGATAPLTPFWALEDAAEAGLRTTARGFGALGRQARNLRQTTPTAIPQPSPPPQTFPPAIQQEVDALRRIGERGRAMFPQSQTSGSTHGWPADIPLDDIVPPQAAPPPMAELPAPAVVEPTPPVVPELPPPTPETSAAQTVAESPVLPAPDSGTARTPMAAPMARRVEGATTTAKVPNKPPYEFQVEVVDLDDPGLLASHNADTFEPTPEYPGQLQPRARGTGEMKGSLEGMRAKFDPDVLTYNYGNLSEGLPIVSDVNGRLIVESGNGRVMLLRKYVDAYEKYRGSASEAASQYGIDPESLAQFKKPLLVRRRTTPLNEAEKQEFVGLANERQTVKMSDAEQARQDMDLINEGMIDNFVVEEGENIDAALTKMGNRSFVDRFRQALPQTEQATMTQGGRISQEGQRRIKNAIFARVFGEDSLPVVQRFFQSTEEGQRRIQDSLTKQIGGLFKVQARVEAGSLGNDLNLAPDLARALENVQFLQEQARSGSLSERIVSHLQQIDFTGATSPEQAMLLQAMGKTQARPGTLSRILEAYTEATLRQPDIRIGSMFDEPTPSRGSLLERAMHDTNLDPTETADLANWGQQSRQAFEERILMEQQQDPRMMGGGAQTPDEIGAMADNIGNQDSARNVIADIQGESAATPAAKQQFAEDAARAKQGRVIVDRLKEVLEQRVKGGSGGGKPPPLQTNHAFESFHDLLNDVGTVDNADTLIRMYDGQRTDLRNRIDKIIQDSRPFYNRVAVGPGRFSKEDSVQMFQFLDGERKLEDLPERLREFTTHTQTAMAELEEGTVEFLEWSINSGADDLLAHDAMDTLTMMGGGVTRDLGELVKVVGRMEQPQGARGITRQAGRLREMGASDNPILQKALEDFEAGRSTIEDFSMTAWDTFMENTKTAIRQRDYIPHRWTRLEAANMKVPSGRKKGQTRAGYSFERDVQSFTEGLEAGRVPRYDDPLATVVAERIEREWEQLGTVFMNHLKKYGWLKRDGDVRRSGSALHRSVDDSSEWIRAAGKTMDDETRGRLETIVAQADEQVDHKKWRVPKVGRPFEGVTLSDGFTTPNYLVPNYIADFLEIQAGRRPSWNVKLPKVGDTDLLRALARTANATKMTKFLLSPFQIVDMLQRSVGFHFAPFNQARIGFPVRKLPGVLWDSMDMYFKWGPSRRAAILERSLDDTTIFPNRPKLTNRYMYKQGLGQRDETVFFDLAKNSLSKVIDDVVAKDPKWKQQFMKTRNWIQEGLFIPFYQSLSLHMMRNVEVPRQMAFHPDWTDAQIAGEAARVVNTVMSSPAAWQRFVVSNPTTQFWARIPFTSLNEQRSWLGIAFEALPFKKNTSARSFAETWAGMLFVFGAMTSLMNQVVYGKQKGESFNPINVDPEQFGYSSSFMRMPLPITGRGGRNIRVDLMGQADTPFRVLDPKQFVLSRVNIPLRATLNQMAGETFMGEPLGGASMKRLMQGIFDMTPIPVEAGLQAARSKSGILQDIVPEGEGRLGTTGNILQAVGGFNLTAAPNRDLRDSVARSMGFDGYSDLEPYQKRLVGQRIVVANNDEIGLATETGARRGQDWAKYQQAVREINDTYDAQLSDLMHEIIPKTPKDDYWQIVSSYYNLESERINRRDQAEKDHDVEFEDREPKNAMAAALQGYYDLMDQSKTSNGLFDSQAFGPARDLYLASLTPEQQEYVARNRNMGWLPPLSAVQQALWQFLYVHAPKEARDISISFNARQKDMTDK